MEKGNQRASSSKPSSSSENKNKNKQDAANKYTRWPRYKSNEGISPRFETRPKPVPQKSRETLDKRPRTRGGVVHERYRDEVTNEEWDIRGKGSKKKCPNLLLDYTIAPSHGRDYLNHRPHNGPRMRIPRHTKEQYLQANCVFVTREGGDYTQHYKNPDLFVNWALVEEVRVPSFEVPSCPICLYPPVAAKITLCGHIYCWACILHYLAICDEPKHQKCPICEELICHDDLKSVLPLTVMPVSTGNTVQMCLMKRARNYVFPVPVEHESSLTHYHLRDVDSITKYQKMLLASAADVSNIIDREQGELKAQLLDEVDEYEAHYVQAALNRLQERMLKNSNGPITNEIIPEVVPGNVESLLNHELDVENKNLASSPDDSLGHDNSCKASECSEDLHTSPTDIHDQENNEGYVYFYQSDDGQHVYLHGLNVRMLIRQFGSLDNCPSVIEGKVVQLEKMSINEALRSRLKYLKHVPITCEFHVAELNLDHLLEIDTIEEFKGEVWKREKLRKKKALEERRREKYIQELENKKLGIFPGATYNLKSSEQFPACVSTREVLETATLDTPEDYEEQYPSFGVANLSLKDDAETSPSTATFAQLLHNGQVSFNLAAPQKSPPEKKFLPNIKDENSEDEEGEKIPEYRQSFSNAIQAALDNAILHEQPTGCNASKKKKMKSRVLFTTSMCRSK